LLSFYALLTKNAVEKITPDTQVMDLALTDLKNVPDFGEIQTVGDFICFLNRYDYIKKMFDAHVTSGTHVSHVSNNKHLPGCDYYCQNHVEEPNYDF